MCQAVPAVPTCWPVASMPVLLLRLRQRKGTATFLSEMLPVARTVSVGIISGYSCSMLQHVRHCVTDQQCMPCIRHERVLCCQRGADVAIANSSCDVKVLLLCQGCPVGSAALVGNLPYRNGRAGSPAEQPLGCTATAIVSTRQLLPDQACMKPWWQHASKLPAAPTSSTASSPFYTTGAYAPSSYASSTSQLKQPQPASECSSNEEHTAREAAAAVLPPAPWCASTSKQLDSRCCCCCCQSSCCCCCC